jgi:hypothetical protein
MPTVEQLLSRIDARLVRIEKKLEKAAEASQPAQPKRLTEKQAMEEYGVSVNVLRRLRNGYKRSDGMKIPPMLFKWGHRKMRNFDYDRDELDKVLKRVHL